MGGGASKDIKQHTCMWNIVWCNEVYVKYHSMHIVVVVLQGCVHYSPMHIVSVVFLVVFFLMVMCVGLDVGVHSAFSKWIIEN